MSAESNDQKILQLLSSEDERNAELAFQLCVGAQAYSEEVAVELRKRVIYCVRYRLEVAYWESLTDLALYSENLKVFPPEIFQLKKLQGLRMWRNQLKTIPPEIGQLTELRSLSLQYNQLTTLPIEISQLTQLRDVYLYGNQFSSEEKRRILKLLPKDCDVRFKKMYNDT